MNVSLAIENIIIEKAADALIEMERRDRYQDFYYNNILYEARFTAKLQQMFNDQRQEVLDNMEGVRQRAAVSQIDDWMFDEAEWQLVFEEFGQMYFPEVIEGRGSDELRRLFVGVSFDVENPRVEQFIKEKAYQFSFETNRETVDKLRQTLSLGIQRGESIPELTKRVNNVFDFNEKYRATRIARTEVLKASNRGAVEAYIQSGVVESKEWLVGPSPCDYCSALNGKTVAVADNFFSKGDTIWGGELSRVLDYEDIGHPPIHPNCVCTIIPVIKQIKTAQEIREDILEYAEINELELHRMEAEIDDLLAKQIQAEAVGNRADSFMFETQAEDIREEVMRFKNQMRDRILEYIDAGQKTESSINLMYVGDFTYHQQARMQPAIEAIEKLIKNVNPQIDNILVTKTAKTRVYFQGNTMYLPHHSAFYSDSPSQILHATGHWLEKNDPVFAEKMKAFYKSRTTGERAKKLGGRYAKDEAFKKDKFVDPYMGKVYKTGQTEIASTGLSYLYKDPLSLARGDPEYFDFLVNTLKGIE